jgi:uncharacterized repeat protein (TIGR04052 family)
LTLDESSDYQNSVVALLDFEDASGNCSGTSTTNTVISGVADNVEYNGIEFKIGVPYSSNHVDVTTASAPLNESGLFWNWRFGYKFFKFDFDYEASGTKSFNLHLGSTSCPDGGGANVAPSGICGQPNVSTISITGNNPLTNAVKIDLSKLLENTYLDGNAYQSGDDSGNAPVSDKSGCMAAPVDPECKGIFNALGLDFTYTGASGESGVYSLTQNQTYTTNSQTVFSFE